MLSETRLGPTAYRGYLLSLEARDNPILAFGMSVAFRNVAIAAVGDIAGTKQCQGETARAAASSARVPAAPAAASRREQKRALSSVSDECEDAHREEPGGRAAEG
jgi:hypothetical protein